MAVFDDSRTTWKEQLVQRRDRLKKEVEKLRAAEIELRELERAISTFEDTSPKCTCHGEGCDVCRFGPTYR